MQAQPKPGFHDQAQTQPPAVQAQGALCLTTHTGGGENLHCLHVPEVLATQGLQALSQGAVQVGLRSLPR